MITRDNIQRHELVGLEAAVSGSSNADMCGICGTVTDETRSTLLFDTVRGKRRIPKAGTVFTFMIPDGQVRVDGDAIARRPAERLVMKA